MTTSAKTKKPAAKKAPAKKAEPISNTAKQLAALRAKLAQQKAALLQGTDKGFDIETSLSATIKDAVNSEKSRLNKRQGILAHFMHCDLNQATAMIEAHYIALVDVNANATEKASQFAAQRRIINDVLKTECASLPFTNGKVYSVKMGKKGDTTHTLLTIAEAPKGGVKPKENKKGPKSDAHGSPKDNSLQETLQDLFAEFGKSKSDQWAFIDLAVQASKLGSMKVIHHLFKDLPINSQMTVIEGLTDFAAGTVAKTQGTVTSKKAKKTA